MERGQKRMRGERDGEGERGREKHDDKGLYWRREKRLFEQSGKNERGGEYKVAIAASKRPILI